MQATRKAILDILKEQGQATVDELAEQLDLTPMTVRHHLNVLKAQNSVMATRLRHSRSVGRPRQVYTLTQTGNELFPANYHQLAERLLDEIKATMSPKEVREIFRRIGEKLAAEAPDVTGLPLSERVSRVSQFLTDRGYISRWEEIDDGFALHQFNCPYRHVAQEHGEVCELDRVLISRLLGVQTERIHGAASRGEHCTYFIPIEAH